MEKIPFGKAKGQAINECSTEDLKWTVDVIDAKLSEDPDGKFAPANQRFVTAGLAELERRAKGGAVETPAATTTPVPSPTAQSIERRPATGVQSLGQAIHDPAAVTAHLAQLAAAYHMVTPATRIDALPPGCGVSITYVTVDPNPNKGGPGEVYSLADKLGLSGTTLARIGAAAGIDWDTERSGRLDNGSDPHYVHFRAVGLVRNFDGSIRTLSGEVEIDAREGSPQIEEIRIKAKRREGGDGGASQILELRKFILRHAESKAKNRAIAGMGVKRSYNPAELTKPFAVARLMFTGETSDPMLRRVFAEKTADAMIGGMAAMYGKTPGLPARREAPARLPEFAGHAPPPPQLTPRDDDQQAEGY